MEEKRKPWSGLAIASLAGGVLSLGLGFLLVASKGPDGIEGTKDDVKSW